MRNYWFSKLLIVVSVLLAVISCTTGGLKQKDLENLHNTKTKKEKMELNNSHEYRLDYMLGGDVFIYAIFLVESSYQYLQVLIKNKKILSISIKKNNRRKAFFPDIKRCTLFPAHQELDVQGCLTNFNREMISLNDPQWSVGVLDLDKSEKDASQRGKYQLIGMTAILSPILVPVAVVAAPFLAADAISENVTQGNFKLKLGKNDNLKEILKKIPEDNKSSFNDNGTFYFASGIVISSPAIGIGFEGENIIWIQRSPGGMCGGGFMFWGNKCVFGRHDDWHY